ncbi:helix-turn-helix domain-containing protein [Halorubrum sp. LN27]|uniref:helix-turn-helix domain-containing protein n=1 Tax=Halorubrum sp. LN27 TaxID=2801032 RepID=UPI0019092C20|nr:helix-turn-helix domain-containing protein [Halorubrum sp. LN27]
MQEFDFTVTYEEGADDLMDVFIENPGLYSRTVSCHATAETMWRVDEVTGPPEALEAYDRRLDGLPRCSNLRGMGGCELDWEHEVLAERPTSRLIYSRQSEGEGCRSVPYLVTQRLGDGALCRAQQYGNTYEWNVLADDDSALSTVYEELEANLRPGLELTFGRVDGSPDWGAERPDADDLPPEQREALRAAIERGYYDTPRRMSLQEVAEAERIPVSTLQYRVSRAEAWLAKNYLSGREALASDPVEVEESAP